ncbi:MAG: hypothetical protein HZA04_00285 [Nitrospinae bacterium]|nr:hypothetical protein [Nitrospinota bacterium]
MATFFVGVVVVALAIFAAAGTYYYFYAGPEEPPPSPPKASAKAVVKAPPPPAPKPAFEIPPWVPRNLGTIKTIAEERPDIVVNIVRRWLREDKGNPAPKP